MAGSKSLSGKEHGFVRCAWARNELSIRYHDEEWGVPQHDDRKLFEFLLLEGAQAGLSWDTILRKRENYRVAFDRFDPERIARYDQRRIRSLLKDPGIVRNRLKIAAAVQNARAFLNVKEEVGSFDLYVWRFVDGQPRVNRWKSLRQVPARTTQSDQMSKDLGRAWLQIRGVDDLLCVHASGRDGERSCGGLFPLPRYHER